MECKKGAKIELEMVEGRSDGDILPSRSEQCEIDVLNGGEDSLFWGPARQDRVAVCCLERVSKVATFPNCALSITRLI
jgi:hypothetical protein